MPDPEALAQLVDDLRLMIVDLDPEHEVYTDMQLERFLAIERYRLRSAAAAALESYAAHLAQVAGPVRGLLDLRVGGEQSANVLREIAKRWRDIDGHGLVYSIPLYKLWSPTIAEEESV